MSLKGKCGVVTGSTSGIGLGIARALAGAGVNVMLNGLGDALEIEKIRSKLEAEFSVRVLYSDADMTRPGEIKAMIEKTFAELGGLDILVNNAGIQHVDAVDAFPDEKWDQIIAINLSSAFHTTKHALAIMKDSGWGRIINIASVHGLSASPFKSAYIAAKHGVIGLTKTVALEVAEQNITANAICPGYVKTPLVEAQIPDTARIKGISEAEVIRDVMLARQPTKEFVGVDEVAAFALFLCSDDAKSITGAALNIDGGWMTL
ncbi:MAG: 3-hydroxybutyrate dehydrogenase [Rhodospirillaceae bacterium]|nr:3-hydroxybutyrate dehydrogenase [Rhodospirillaceae bacterium]